MLSYICISMIIIFISIITNIMRNNADFINLTLVQKNTFLVTKSWRETLNCIYDTHKLYFTDSLKS